ncbi:hypothetical protein CEUSTIGMA_g12016.t1 [Chlamydomonas eustigma]|uniref:Uncharacterized protein n=1 Tax=Chlamydomonas eustigma TaxID=1157962 RepID=A0A250XNC9_9CHLO|nr:hypothetical protein CEUSTIGMA_g12016.t1 [Chlamydomonas eustigma]|eukprot:GAX84595.1 hypothetical protein CEUSTIGMA_g12016.t1 [Chlamydomonas eustigma]
MTENFEDFDTGDSDYLVNELKHELSTEGFDCASVDLILRMARDGEIESVGDVLGSLAAAGHPYWSGQILRMTIWPDDKTDEKRGEPNYFTASGVLSYLIDMGQTTSARNMCPHILVSQPQGPDCYDLSFIVGNMVSANKSKQAAKLMLSLYSDESKEGQQYRPLLPCMLGTMIDFGQPGWASEIIKSLCVDSHTSTTPEVQPDYSTAGWCLAQTMVFGRADWACSIVHQLRSQQPAWYHETALINQVRAWGGDRCVQDLTSYLMQ